MKGQQGMVIMSLKLHRTGEIISYTISKSSGHRTLDKASIQAVTSTNLVPFPDAIRHASLAIQVPFVFELK